MFFSPSINVIPAVIKPKIIPLIVAIKALILCFIISVSEFASNLGCFKFIINPKIALNVGNIKLAKMINIMSNIFILNAIKNIISQIKITGIDIILLVNTFASNIFLLDTGKLFVISIFFPSNEIIDDVIEVIKLIKTTKHKYILDIYCITVSVDISTSIPLEKPATNPLKFVTNPIVATTINTSPKPEFIINTGDVKNLFSSLAISAYCGFFTLYLLFLITVFLLIPFSPDFEIIVK